MTTSTERQNDHQARGLTEMRRRADQSQHRANKRWAALDVQAVDQQRRLDAARQAGDARRAEYARRALDKIVAGMGKLLSEQQMPDLTQPQPGGDPWARR